MTLEKSCCVESAAELIMFARIKLASLQAASKTRISCCQIDRQASPKGHGVQQARLLVLIQQDCRQWIGFPVSCPVLQAHQLSLSMLATSALAEVVPQAHPAEAGGVTAMAGWLP